MYWLTYFTVCVISSITPRHFKLEHIKHKDTEGKSVRFLCVPTFIHSFVADLRGLPELSATISIYCRGVRVCDQSEVGQFGHRLTVGVPRHEDVICLQIPVHYLHTVHVSQPLADVHQEGHLKALCSVES